MFLLRFRTDRLNDFGHQVRDRDRYGGRCASFGEFGNCEGERDDAGIGTAVVRVNVKSHEPQLGELDDIADVFLASAA